MRPLILIALTLSSVFAGDASIIEKTPGLVGFWTFGEEAGQKRVSQGTKEQHPLSEVNGPIKRSVGGPFSGYAADLNGSQYFEIKHSETGDLNISGKDAQVSMFAVVRIVNLKKSRTIAGMWSEGKGANDDTGTRQYALLMNMPTYGGNRQLVPHISSEGGVTMRADGTKFPWCADYAATKREVPEEEWCTLAFTYDSKYLRTYINGVLDQRQLDAVKDKRNDPYFTKEGPDGKDRGMNPYYHGRGIFKYDPVLHAKTKIAPSDFTVGARMAVGSMTGEATIGKFGGLAVFNCALSDAELKHLHDAAGVETLNAQPPPKPVIFRHPKGSVTLEGENVLYTLDGSDPVAKSNPYLAPIALASGSTVKARSFSKDRKRMSEVATMDYEPLPGHQPLPSTVVPVTQDRSWPSYDWRKRHELTSAAVRRSKPQILFIGDSITHFFGGEQFDGYVLRGKNTWDEFYAPRKAGNLGFGWDKTENVLWRLQHGSIDGIAPKLVVMMIGTNNTGDCSAPDIAQGIIAIVSELNQRLPQSKILLLGIFPRGEKPNPQREKIAVINQLLAQLDGERNVTFLDIGPKFLTPDGLITKDIMPDYLHPNEKGYRIWAEAIEPTVKKLMGE
ncbi:MAG TPA: hypothetical protein DDZ88_20235 [Verrucomicrobiales bacterium]|nr:hypothetical protein [Verrucomicrobiales bacterium]